MESELAADLLDGMPAIAKFYGCTERRGYYLAENKLIPRIQSWGKVVREKIDPPDSYREAGGEPCLNNRVRFPQSPIEK